jgi:arylsulfatase A-like enzyme
MVQFDRRAVVAGLAAAAAAGGARAAPSARPNIVFILADDLGYADLSCYGRRDYATPVLDRMAREGRLFTDAYANAPVCSPTRVALLTGRYQYRTDAGLREPLFGADHPVPPAGDPTLASVLRRAGYHTSLVGKWHLGRYPDQSPRRYGYDYAFGFSGPGYDYFTHSGPAKRGDGLWENDQRVEVPGYLTDVLTDKAVQVIRENARARRPFFLSLHYTAPHWPWEGPGDAAVAPTVTDGRHYDGGSVATYAKMVQAMDAGVGRVLDALRTAGVDRDTLVVFTSDNGAERFSDTFPFVGYKGELLEGGIRVPLIARWPGRIRPGSRSGAPIMSMDFLPTFARLAGGAPDPAHPPDGVDVSAALVDGAAAPARKLYWRYKAFDQAAVRDGDWKYLKIGGNEFLFNLAQDQRERADLKGREAARFQALKADWAAWNAQMLPYPADMTSENLTNGGRVADRY